MDGVGSIDEFGFDVIVFADTGQIWQCLHYSEPGSERISVNFANENTYDILGTL